MIDRPTDLVGGNVGDVISAQAAAVDDVSRRINLHPVSASDSNRGVAEFAVSCYPQVAGAGDIDRTNFTGSSSRNGRLAPGTRPLALELVIWPCAS